MQTVQIAFYAGSFQTLIFSSDAAAANGYAAIKAAMENFDRFRNDKASTVTVKDDVMGETTLRVEHLSAVCLSGTEATEPVLTAWSEHRGRVAGAAKRGEAQANPAPQ